MMTRSLYGLYLIAVSTNSLEAKRVWRERREDGSPGVMPLGDRTGQVACCQFLPAVCKAKQSKNIVLGREYVKVACSFGVLDSANHLAYPALFIVDEKVIVQVNAPAPAPAPAPALHYTLLYTCTLIHHM